MIANDQCTMPKPRSQILLSLPLLLVVYAALGWLVKDWHVSRDSLLLLLLVTFVVDIMAIYPYQLLEIFFTGVFGADWKSLFLVMATATLLVMIITWLPIVYYVLLMLTATLLLSLDFHELQYNHWQSFLLLVVCQMVGLGLGLVGNIYWWRGIEYLQRYHYHFPK
jgi:hypothetical protein